MRVRHLIISVICCLTGACGIRQTALPDGTITVDLFVGAGPVPDCSADPGHAAQITQLGAWASALGGGIGYRSARYMCGKPRCQVIIWDDGVSVEQLRAWVGETHALCERRGKTEAFLEDTQ